MSEVLYFLIVHILRIATSTDNLALNDKRLYTSVLFCISEDSTQEKIFTCEKYSYYD